MHHGPAAVVLTEGTDKVCFLGVGEGIHIVQSDEGTGRIPLFGPLLCDQRGADGSHQARIGRADDFPSYILLNGA